jgi:UDP-3-O-[3-hydroxymyristoyl] glucosamine N-acyltransferase
VFVGPDCQIGEGSVLHPHVVLRERVTLGRRVLVHPGSVLGADGFGYAFDGRAHRKIPQVGRVVVEDDVEIGANVTVDRATLGETVIGRGTKIDNLVQIGHNTVVGPHTIIVAQAGIAGSCRIGSGVVLAGQAGIADHVTVGDGAQIGSQAGVHRDVPAGAGMIGTPAMSGDAGLRALAAIGRLPDLLRDVRALGRRLAALEQRLDAQGGPAARG